MNKIKEILKSNVLVLLLDVVSVNLAYYLALILRNTITDMGAGMQDAGAVVYFSTFHRFAPIYTAICILVFLLFKL